MDNDQRAIAITDQGATAVNVALPAMAFGLWPLASAHPKLI